MNNIQINDFEIGNTLPLTIIGGVNVLESDQLCSEVANTFVDLSKKHSFNFIFKGSFDKANRSSYKSFRGPGLTKGLHMLEKIKNDFDVPVITDIHEPNQANLVAQVCDIIQIPAFLCRQTDLIQAAAETRKPLHIKKPQFLSASDMKNVVEKCFSFGNENILLCERGNIFGYNNLVVDMLNFQTLKSFKLPVIFDVTHSLQIPGGLGISTGGRRELFLPFAKSGVAQKIAGLFIETHTNPDDAKCDGPCAININNLDSYLKEIVDLDKLIKAQED